MNRNQENIMDLFSFGEESSSLMEFCEEFIKTEPEIDEFNSNIEFIDTSGVKENVNIQSEINKEKFQSDHNPLEADLLDLSELRSIFVTHWQILWAKSLGQ